MFDVRLQEAFLELPRNNLKMKGLFVRFLAKRTWVAMIVVACCAYPWSAMAEEERASDTSEIVSSDQIAQWIAQLDSGRYLIREQASRQLIDAGQVALDSLLATAQGDRLEPAARAVWILREIGRSKDLVLAIASLDRLVQLEDRPSVVSDAIEARKRLTFQLCQDQIASLGGRIEITQDNIYGLGTRVHLTLDDQWRGTVEDLRSVAELPDYSAFWLEGSPIGDGFLEYFEQRDDVKSLQLYYTRVTPAGVDSLKQQQPETFVFVADRALLGIQGETHEIGVLVSNAPAEGGAANAGLQVGDVITRFNGKPLPDFDRLTAHIAQYEPGDTVTVSFLRGAEEKTVSVTLGLRDDL